MGTKQATHRVVFLGIVDAHLGAGRTQRSKDIGADHVDQLGELRFGENGLGFVQVLDELEQRLALDLLLGSERIGGTRRRRRRAIGGRLGVSLKRKDV